MVSICLVGAGFVAAEHCRAYDAIDDATVTVVVAPNSAAEFIDRHDLNATAYQTLEPALDSPIDAIDICSPTPTHRDITERGLNAGLPVLCEKPLTRTLADATALRTLAADTSAPVMVGHVVRFFPQYEAAQEQVQAGRLGTPAVARARRLSPFPTWGDWYANRDASGGLFFDLAIHDFDYLRWVFGEVERVFARRTMDAEFAHGSATLAFENGAKGYVEASWGQPKSRDLTYEFELSGSDGVLTYDNAGDAPVQRFTAADAHNEQPLAERDGYVQQLTHFIECVRENTEPRVGIEDAIQAMRLSIASNRSAEQGEPVRLTEVPA